MIISRVAQNNWKNFQIHVNYVLEWRIRIRGLC